MTEQIKILIAILLGSILLWIGTSYFLDESDNYADSLTVSSTAYLSKEQAVAELKEQSKKGDAALSETVDANFEKVKEDVARAMENDHRSAAQKADQPNPAVNNDETDEEQKQKQSDNKDEQDSDKKTAENAENDDVANKDENDAQNELQLKSINEEPEQRADSTETQTANSSDSSGSSNQSNTQSNNTSQSNKNKNPIDLSSQESKLAEREENTVRGIELALVTSEKTQCSNRDKKPHYVGVLFRGKSASIKGVSLSDIDKLVELLRLCDGTLVIVPNERNSRNLSESLVERRQKEVKYYLLQRRVPKENILVSNNS